MRQHLKVSCNPRVTPLPQMNCSWSLTRSEAAWPLAFSDHNLFTGCFFQACGSAFTSPQPSLQFHPMHVQREVTARISPLHSCHCSRFSSGLSLRAVSLALTSPIGFVVISHQQSRNSKECFCALKEYTEGMVISLFEECIFNLPIIIESEPL